MMNLLDKLKYDLYKIYHPEIFQGRYKKKSYFEGWYFKIINKEMDYALAIIPGISIGENYKDGHAFIQLLDNNGYTHYISYNLSEFQFDEGQFIISIGGNYFSKNYMKLNIDREGTRIYGKVYFTNIVDLPKGFLKPGIMGPFSYVPFMECFHGIVNIHHKNIGYLNINGNKVDFTQGYGYIEKDWGRSFPEKWIWIQSNHFGNDNVTFMFSVAKIPWFGFHFRGFLALIQINGHVHVFATYTNARIKLLKYNDARISAVIEDKHYRVKFQADNNIGGYLKAPGKGAMTRVVKESINARLRLKIMDKQGRVIYSGTGTNTGVEISM